MKKILLIIVLCCVTFGCVGCGQIESDVLRIHIRANSNCNADQEVKLLVKDRVVDFITPLIANCENAEDVKTILKLNLNNIEEEANLVLNNNGFNYVSNAEIKNEYFPTRSYDGVCFKADYYDALILRLGSGCGDNWWCVAYPPLCFVGGLNGSGDVKYRSKIFELINKYLG